MKAFRFILLLGLVCLAVISTPVCASIYTFTEEDNGKTVDVKPGDSVTVSLHENPSTGFSWSMDSSRGLMLKNDVYKRANSGLIGAGGVHDWTYLVLGSGSLSISGIYKQPWMPTTGDEETFTLLLNSGEQSFRNSRTWNWWESVPQSDRIALAAERLNEIKKRLP